MSSRMARPGLCPWPDVEGTHIPDGCGVKRIVEVDRLYGRAQARRGRRSEPEQPGRSACGHTLGRLIEEDGHDR